MTPRGHVLVALTRREAAIARSYPLARALTLAFGALNLTLYYFISRTLSPSRSAQLGAAPTYFAFAAAGVAIATVVQAATAALARRVREEQLTYCRGHDPLRTSAGKARCPERNIRADE